jgi:hypothetical protein
MYRYYKFFHSNKHLYCKYLYFKEKTLPLEKTYKLLSSMYRFPAYHNKLNTGNQHKLKPDSLLHFCDVLLFFGLILLHLSNDGL